MPESDFVKEINEKGYYAQSRSLDNEVDVELYLHLFKHNRETYISLQRGKHRIPTILSEEKKYALIKFPKNMPIPENLNEANHEPLRKLPSRAVSNTSEDMFKL